jgi:hypothetical protein
LIAVSSEQTIVYNAVLFPEGLGKVWDSACLQWKIQLLGLQAERESSPARHY